MPVTAKHADSIFWKAQEFASPDERAAYLDQACGGDPQLRAQIDELLGAYPKVDHFLESPAVAFAATCDHPTTEHIGSMVGRYKLLEQVGEGGMGVVYVAEQTEPVRRRVALKIIKPGMDTKQVIARFEAERQALAMMDHPNIAKILDAGTTEGIGSRELGVGQKHEECSPIPYSRLPTPSSARPYFVMELVRGMPITEYCDKARLSPRQRLELFVDVCQAVQHAHQKGIIHRDLKPSNVMVTMQDGRPVVKVIDFGVAKAVGQQLTERTVYTALTQLVGTPLYMSPEQAELTSHDVDTRSDVYSLGVLLYELLTGQTPFDKETLSKAGLDEMRRIIREDEPLRPSRRFSTLGAAAISTASQHRGVDERRLSRILCGELDWIVMKALEKDRSRRYESASALAADIQRYLSDEPVLACPPTTMYRFQKFARKHKPALATAAAIALCLILGTTVSAWQAARATTAEAQANANEQKAVTNEQKANTERDEAQKQRDEVRTLNDQLRQTLYASNMNLAEHAWEVGNIGRVDALLAQHRPKPGETDLRNFEWHYLNRRCHPELFTLKGHTNTVDSVVFSPDGKRLASSSRGVGRRPRREIKVWDAQTGTVLLTLNGGDSQNVAFSPDGKHLASGSNTSDDPKKSNDVKVWDSQTGHELLSIGHGSRVTEVAFSPDGKRLASGGGGRDGEGNLIPASADVKVWDAATGANLLTLKGHTTPINCVVFSPDGKRLASASWDEPVKVWDAQTGEILLTLDIAYGNIAFSPGGKRLAIGSKVWDAQTGEEVLVFKGHTRDLWSVAFSPDGQRVASAAGPYWEEKTVKIWDSKTGQELLTINGTGANVAFSPDGTRLASGSRDGTVKIWDATTSDQHDARTFRGHTGSVSSVTLSQDGKRLAGVSRNPMTKDTAVKVWDARTGQELLSLTGQAGLVHRVAFSPDGTLLASASKGTWDDTNKDAYVAGKVRVWDSQTGREIYTFTGHPAAVVSVAFSPDSTRVVSSGYRPNSSFGGSRGPGEVKVWDARTGQEHFSLSGHGRFVNSVAFSPDGKRLATISWDQTVKVWDAQNGQAIHTMKVRCDFGASVAFSPDAKRLATTGSLPEGSPGSGMQEIKVWDTQTGHELLSLKGQNAQITSVVFSPDGKRLASGSGTPRGRRGEVKVWDTQTGQELLTLKGEGYHDGISFTPDGHWLASDLGGKVTIWDATPLPEKP